MAYPADAVQRYGLGRRGWFLAVLELAREVLTWTHPQEAVEIAERYAAGHHRKRERALLVHDMASLEARGQAAKREIEALFAAEEDGGRAAAQMLRAIRQRALEAPSLSPEDMIRLRSRRLKRPHRAVGISSTTVSATRWRRSQPQSTRKPRIIALWSGPPAPRRSLPYPPA